MAEHILGKDEIQVRFLLGAPLNKKCNQELSYIIPQAQVVISLALPGL